MSKIVKIKGLDVPSELVESINSGNWKKLSAENLASTIPFFTDPIVFLKDLTEIEVVSENTDVIGADFLGIMSSNRMGKFVGLPYLDFDHCLFIAINKYPGDDIAIVLDYRHDKGKPQVVASDFNGKYSHCEWKVVADTFDDFCANMGLQLK